MGKVAKMVSGFLTSGGAAAVMTGAGLPLEVVTPVVAALTALVGAYAIRGALTDAHSAFLWRDPHAEWIRQGGDIGLRADAGGRTAVLSFRRRFSLQEVPDRAVVLARALRDYEIWVNHRRVGGARDPRPWLQGQ